MFANSKRLEIKKCRNFLKDMDDISLRKCKLQFVVGVNFLEGLKEFLLWYVEPDFIDTDPGTVITPVLNEYQVILALSKMKK